MIPFRFECAWCGGGADEGRCGTCLMADRGISADPLNAHKMMCLTCWETALKIRELDRLVNK